MDRRAEHVAQHGDAHLHADPGRSRPAPCVTGNRPEAEAEQARQQQQRGGHQGHHARQRGVLGAARRRHRADRPARMVAVAESAATTGGARHRTARRPSPAAPPCRGRPPPACRRCGHSRAVAARSSRRAGGRRASRTTPARSSGRMPRSRPGSRAACAEGSRAGGPGFGAGNWTWRHPARVGGEIKPALDRRAARPDRPAQVTFAQVIVSDDIRRLPIPSSRPRPPRAGTACRCRSPHLSPPAGNP